MTIGAVAVARLVIATGASEALAEPGITTLKRQASQAGSVIDFASATPMPLRETSLPPASLADAMLKAPAASSAKPGRRTSALGNGQLTPVELVF